MRGSIFSAKDYTADLMCMAEAGTVSVTNNPACPAETISLSVSGNNTSAEYGTFILIVDDTGEIVDIINGNSGDYTYGYCGEFTAYSYNYEIATVTVLPHISDQIGMFDCLVDCCALSDTPFSYEDLTNPFFTYLPQHPFIDPGTGMLLPIYCVDDLPVAENAEYDDNCIGIGISEPLVIDATNPCDGGILSWSWSLQDSCVNSGTITSGIVFTIEPAGIATFVDPPANYTTDCNNIPTTGPMLTYTNGQSNSCAVTGGVTPTLENNVSACGGEVLLTWSDVDMCGRTVEHVQTVTISPPGAVDFVDPPASMVITCDEIPSDIPPVLTVSNGAAGACLIEEDVIATVQNNYNGCDGSIVNVWTYDVECGATIQYTQILTIVPPLQASFIDPPFSEILACQELSLVPTTLDYSNGDVGDCEISGTIEAVVIGNVEACGGLVSYFWDFEDDCGRSISHTQNITILAAPDPVFIDVPDDITLFCGEVYFPPALVYTNSLEGECVIEGLDFPTTTQEDNIITIHWEIDECNGINLQATQIATIAEGPILEVAPSNVMICIGDSYDLDNLTITQTGGLPGPISFHYDNPPTAANELPSTMITPNTTTNYTVAVTDPDGCVGFTEVIVTVEMPVESASSGTLILCGDATVYNLFDILVNVVNNDGTWLDFDDSMLDISDPTSVDFSGLEPGTYRYQYTGISTNSCDPDVDFATVIVGGDIQMQVLSIACAADELTYDVQIEATQGATIIANDGTVNMVNDSIYTITNISIDSTLSLLGLGVNLTCNDELLVMAPDCNCPDVEAPMAGQTDAICPHEAPVTLTASAAVDLTINWYDLAVGGVPLATDAAEYMPLDFLPGTYTYYVESEDANGCTSAIRNEIWFTILAPVAEDTLYLSSCIDFDTEESTFTLQDISLLLEMNATAPLPWTVEPYATSENAISQVDELPNEIVVSGSDTIVIFVRVSDDAGCFGIVPITLQPSPYPTATLDISPEVCDDESDGSVTLSFSQNNILSDVDGQAYNEEFYYDLLATGIHTVFLQDDNLCLNEIDFEIEIGFLITIDTLNFECMDNETSSDVNDDFWTMTFNLSTDSGSGSYSLVIDGVEVGIYDFGQEFELVLPADMMLHTILFVDLITNCGRPVSSPILIPCSTTCTEFPDASIDLDQGSVLDCAITELFASSANEVNVVYTWMFDGFDFDPSEQITTTGQLTLLAIDTITGCMADSMIVIDENITLPTIVILQPEMLTCEDGQVTIDASMSPSSPQYSYQWLDENGLIAGENNEFLDVNSSGWFYIEISDADNNCTAIDSIFVFEDGERPEIQLLDSVITACGETEIDILVSITNATNYTVAWTSTEGVIVGADDAPNVMVDGPGIYYISVSNDDNMCVSIDSITVATAPLPSLDNLIIVDDYCDATYDGYIQFDANGGTAPYDFWVNSQSIETTELYLEANLYLVEVVDANGCTKDSIITINPSVDIEIDLDVELEYLDGEDNVLTATVNIPDDQIDSIQWSPNGNLSCDDCLSPTVLSGVNETYTITVIGTFGCQSVTSINMTYEEVEVTPPSDIVIPNIFSPNGDGINDYFTITLPEGIALDYLEVYVFDRWGEQVYFGDQLQSADESAFWNGTLNGSNVNPGVYVYYAKAIVTGTLEERVFYGDVSVVR